MQRPWQVRGERWKELSCSVGDENLGVEKSSPVGSCAGVALVSLPIAVLSAHLSHPPVSPRRSILPAGLRPPSRRSCRF